MRTSALLVPVFTLALSTAALAQGPPMPGPEHDVLKRDVGVWVDSMGSSINQSESTFDAATGMLTGWMEMVDPSGSKSRTKTQETWPTADTRLVRVFPPDGGTEPLMKITSTRRK